MDKQDSQELKTDDRMVIKEFEELARQAYTLSSYGASDGQSSTFSSPEKDTCKYGLGSAVSSPLGSINFSKRSQVKPRDTVHLPSHHQGIPYHIRIFMEKDAESRKTSQRTIQQLREKLIALDSRKEIESITHQQSLDELKASLSADHKRSIEELTEQRNKENQRAFDELSARLTAETSKEENEYKADLSSQLMKLKEENKALQNFFNVSIENIHAVKRKFHESDGDNIQNSAKRAASSLLITSS